MHLLTPDVLTGALPAHAIAWALPIENSTELSTDSQLFTEIKLSSHSENEKQVNKDGLWTR
jgi:hypothetical protein